MNKKSTKSASVRITSRWTKPAVAIGHGETYLVISIEAPKVKRSTGRQPVDVSFVIDRSGSMSGAPLELAKQAVISAIGLLGEHDAFSVIGYDNDVRDLVCFQPATVDNRARAIAALREVFPGGSTNLFGGWYRGAQSVHAQGGFDTRHGRIRRTILLSDGHANVGETNPQQIAWYVSRERQFGVTTSALGLGPGVDDLLLSGMAEAGGGNYAFAEHPRQLPDFFARELGEALTIVATDVTLNLTLPKGLRAELLDPFPVDRIGKTLSIAIGDVPAGVTINLVFSVTSRAKSGQSFAPVDLRATWRTIEGATVAPDVIPIDPVIAMSATDFAAMPFDDEAHSLAATKISANARRDAMRMYKEGRAEDARTRLYSARDNVMSAPNATELGDELTTLTNLNPAMPEFETSRKVAMSNAHRDARNRER